MLKRVARFFSYLFHPLIMPTMGLFLLFSYTYLAHLPAEGKRAIYLIVFITTCVLPLSIIPIFLYKNLIKNVQMKSRKERMKPLFITAILYYFSYYLLGQLAVPELINTFMLGIVISITLTFMISYIWRISAHMVGIGGITGAILALSIRLMIDIQLVFMLLIFIAGLIGTSRLYLQAHKPSQVYSGFFLGGFTLFIVILFR